MIDRYATNAESPCLVDLAPECASTGYRSIDDINMTSCLRPHMSRRDLIHYGAFALGTIALPATRLRAQAISPVMATLSGYMAAAKDHLPLMSSKKRSITFSIRSRRCCPARSCRRARRPSRWRALRRAALWRRSWGRPSSPGRSTRRSSTGCSRIQMKQTTRTDHHSRILVRRSCLRPLRSERR